MTGRFSGISKEVGRWIWFGISVRLLVMPFTAHPDLFINFANTFHLVDSGVVDIYRYLADYYADEQAMAFLYDPLHYLMFGLWSGWTGLWVGSEYQIWMREVVDSMFSNHLEKIFSFPGSEVRFKTLFSWKCLYLIFDFFILFVVLRFLPEEKQRRSFAALWAGSVVLIYSVYMFGQSGIIPTALIVLGLSLFKIRAHLKWVGLCFALSVPFKLFSLLLLPLPFLLAKGSRAKIETALFSILPLLLVYIPFAVHSEGLVFWRLYGGYVAYATEGITWHWVLIASKAALGVGYLAVCYHAWFRGSEDPQDLARYLFIILLLLLSVPLKIYYYVWVLPFWFLFVGEKKIYRTIYGIIIVLLFFSNLSARQTFVGIFAPLEHDFFMAFPGWMDIGYFFFPSGIHARLSVLVIFLLTLAVVYDQLLTLFGRKALFRQGGESARPEAGVRTALWAYPVVLIAALGSLLFVSQAGVRSHLKDYLLASSSTPFHWNALPDLSLAPGESVVQQVALLKGRVRDIRYRVQADTAGPVRVEVLSAPADGETLYDKDFATLKAGWMKFELAQNFIKNKIVYFRITNQSSESMRVPVYRTPKGLKNFQLLGGNGGDEPVARSVLPLVMSEEPDFFYSEQWVVRSILANMSMEKNFLFLWLLVTGFCFAQSLRYSRPD